MLIALIEDNAELQAMTARFLRQHGYQVSAVAAAEELAELPDVPDFYIVDLNLPTISGYELIGRIRQTAEDVGIIVTTARNRSEDVSRGYEIGADVYLTKPVDPAVLLAAIKRLEARTKATAAHQNSGIVYRASRRLQASGGQVQLSQAEMRLLYQLGLAGVDGLERWEVMELLGLDLDAVSKNTLEVRITRLRGKLRAVGIPGEVISAIHSWGYKLTGRVEFQ